ncbi:hypothetical protein NPIL_403981 [Nephila pilipes]|uniref:Uncharacterized protein n=1 Tax=Nephila pilipes TaxID=299642 RepID=A0A8X6U7P2_NEPPI|nr:hypothetical protein NPIL_403981 [Nephila pilipes]
MPDSHLSIWLIIGRTKFRTLREFEEYWDDDLDEDLDGTKNIVELPLDRVEDGSDLAGVDDNIQEEEKIPYRSGIEKVHF